MTLLHCCVEQSYLTPLSQRAEEDVINRSLQEAWYTEADSEIHSNVSHSDLSAHAVGGPALIVSIYTLMFTLWI